MGAQQVTERKTHDSTQAPGTWFRDGPLYLAFSVNGGCLTSSPVINSQEGSILKDFQYYGV